MALKDNLIKFMKEKKLTIRALSERTQISEPTLKRLRSKDGTNPTIDILIKIASELNVSVNQLIENNEARPVLYQGNPLILDPKINEFIYIFTEKTFNFKKSTRAIFKKYQAGNPLTKYIINKEGQIFERVEGEKWIYADKELNNYSIDNEFIFAYIIKQLYEVNYV
jgi:transcriptional regulator with XRE-family HTH domain